MEIFRLSNGKSPFSFLSSNHCQYHFETLNGINSMQCILRDDYHFAGFSQSSCP